MDRVFLHIYDFFATRRGLLWTVFGVLSMVLAVMAWQVEYEESLYSIMPDDRSGGRATEVLRNLKVKDKVVVIFSTSQESAGDPEQLCEAAAWFEDRLIELTGGENISSIVSQTGEGEFGGIVSLVYDDLPSMLGESDYDRLDSLLSTPGALDAVMERNRRVMGSIAGIGLSDNILRDPPGIAVNSLARLSLQNRADGPGN